MKWENCWSDGCPPKISRGHIFWLYLKKHCLALQPSSPLFHLLFWELFKVHLWWKDNIFLWNFWVFVEWKMSFWEKYYACFADWGGFCSLSLCLLFPWPDCTWKQQMSVDLMKSFGIIWCSLRFLQGFEGTVWHTEQSSNLQLTSLR